MISLRGRGGHRGPPVQAERVATFVRGKDEDQDRNRPCELGPYGYLPSEPERLIAELSSRGLSMVSAFVPLPLAEPERHDSSFREAMTVAELLASANARLLVLAGDMNGARMNVAGRVNE